jgi:hypothetical protein
MSTPIYKSLKANGTTIYAFPGAEEDINQRSDNYNISFNKFVLLNLPESQTALDDEPKKWDFDNAFYTSSDQPATNFGDKVVNSLRNYVANHETVIKTSRINDNEYFYDNSVLQTNSERIFWKWCKKLNLIQFEPAVDGDEYFGNLAEFESNDPNDNEYLREYLWKEREVSNNSISIFYESSTLSNKLEVEYSGTINYKEGDFVEFKEVENVNFPVIAKYAQVLSVIEPSGSDGWRVIYDITYTGSQQTETVGYSSLVYNKLVRYIGEIQGNNNVVSQNLSFDQIFAQIADNAGETPDILFRTRFDSNYSPDLSFPILPAQYQPEILGAENFNNPIVKNPTNYPGDQYAQYDNDDNLNEYTYLTKTGDINRRTGTYFGVTGDTNNVTFDGSDIDGVQIDFDIEHYVKMNILGEEDNNFDEFNTRQVNGEFPSDFKFNAILWYYDAEDINGNVATNLYGISFLDNPANDLVETNNRFPQVNKIVATNDQDGTSYQFSLNRHTTITTEIPQPIYSNEYVNNLFGMNLFNEAMRRLATLNDSALTLISENKSIMEEVDNIKQLVYTQTDLETINDKLNNLNELLKLYSTNQIVDTDSISVVKNNSVSPPEIQLFNIEGRYGLVNSVSSSDLYDSDGYIPYSIDVPEGKDFLVNIINDDTLVQTLPNEQVLTVFLNRDLYYRQTVDFIIDSNILSTENKKLNIMVQYNNGQGVPVLETLVSELDLPVYFNTVQQTQNTANTWKQIYQDITQFKLNDDGETMGFSASRTNGLSEGDVILLQNVIFDTEVIDGQYIIDSLTDDTINIDYSQNNVLNTWVTQQIVNGDLSTGDIIIDYNTMGYFKFNKGYKISITRVDELNTSSFENRYKILINSNE